VIIASTVLELNVSKHTIGYCLTTLAGAYVVAISLLVLYLLADLLW
jgi:hypothetical protein